MVILGGIINMPKKRSFSIRLLRPAAVTSALTAAVLGVPAIHASATPATGGTLTVLEESGSAGEWPAGFDPATSAEDLIHATMMNAIYGELFQLGANGKLIYDLATGASLTNANKTLTITLRKGVRFTDGTPFNAAAVVQNFKQDLASNSTAEPPWQVSSVTAANKNTVVVNFKTADGAAINQFQDSNVNWIESPTSLQRLGPKNFAITPVGAGPFSVVSDVLNTKLVLKRNPNYWQKGRPYLDGLVFEVTANDETALEAIKSGAGQVYENMTTPALLKSYQAAGLTVTKEPATTPEIVQLNTLKGPFTNIKAREAVYYAIDTPTLVSKVFDNQCTPTESFTGPASLFYFPKVPGYRSYNPSKAKALVKQLGGLSFTLTTQATSSTATVFNEAVQTMLVDAGMKVQILNVPNVAEAVQLFHSGKWEIQPAALGSWDPAADTGVAFRLLSTGPFSGIKDPAVDRLITEGAATTNKVARARYYRELSSYLNEKAYMPFICAPPTWNIAAKGVEGPGLTTSLAPFAAGPQILWQDVSDGAAH